MSDWYSESEKALQRQTYLRDEVTQLRAELEAVKAERDLLLDNPDFVDYLEATCERDNLNQELSDALFHCGVLEAEVERLVEEVERLRGGVEMAEAETAVLRGAGCEEDGDGPCGICIRCYRKRADAAEARVKELENRCSDYAARYGQAGVRFESLQDRIDSLESQLAASQAALRAVLPFIDDQPVRRWDALADAFYADTGIMAPGKSVAPEMAMSQPPDDVRRDQYAKWIVTKQGRVRALIDAALAAKPERPAGGES